QRSAVPFGSAFLCERSSVAFACQCAVCGSPCRAPGASCAGQRLGDVYTSLTSGRPNSPAVAPRRGGAGPPGPPIRSFVTLSAARPGTGQTRGPVVVCLFAGLWFALPLARRRSGFRSELREPGLPGLLGVAG